MSPVELETLLLREALVATVLALRLDISDFLNRLLNCLEVRKQAAQPPVVDVELATTLCFFLDGILCLSLRSNEENLHVRFGRHGFRDVGERVSEKFLRLLQVDDVDSVSFTEDVFLHLRVPSSDLVSKVNSRFEKFLHGYCCHC